MFPLTVDHLLWRMSNVHAASEVVSITADTATTRRTFPEVAQRSRQLAAGMTASLGLGTGDTVAVLAFNTVEHFEGLVAVPLLGATVNSLNVRLSPQTLVEQALSPAPAAALVDAEMLDHPVLGVGARTVLRALDEARVPLIVVGDQDWGSLTGLALRYDDLVAVGVTAPAPAPVEDENTPAYLFHTSGTTGRPKSYPVSHRAVVLHTLSQATTEATGLTRGDRVLPLAPFFHVNGWGLPLTCALTGASLVLCGGDLAPERVARVLDEESVTVAAAVPTVWHDVCAAVATGGAPRPGTLREVLSGGSAVPRSVVRAVADVLGARVGTAWGMTETMACSTFEREDPATSAGVPIPLVELRIDHDGFDTDADSAGPVMGRLQVRGPFVVGTPEGSDYFDTGDIASLDERGRLSLHDRAKDLIKSGGEWIATAELEQCLCTHPAVTAAAVVPIAHPRWIERPLAYVVTDGDVRSDIESLLASHVGDHLPRWWIPDQFVVVETLPRTAVGKIDKAQLRARATSDIRTRSEVIA